MSLTVEGSRVARQTPPLVGRDADLRQLDRALAAAAGGTGQVILVSGEAGIGKTRLCAELCQAHRERGGPAAVGRVFPEEASIPFAALADALRGAWRAYPPLWEAVRSRARVLWPVERDPVGSARRYWTGSAAGGLAFFVWAAWVLEMSAGAGIIELAIERRE